MVLTLLLGDPAGRRTHGGKREARDDQRQHDQNDRDQAVRQDRMRIGQALGLVSASPACAVPPLDRPRIR
jgi:hypothetical protein